MPNHPPNSPDQLSILLVDDNQADAEYVRELLLEAKPTARVVWVQRGSEALARLEVMPTDVVLLDLSLPDCMGLEGVQKLHAAFPFVPLVVLTSSNDEAMALAAVAAGAQDYLVKSDASSRVLLRTIGYAIERQQFVYRLHQMAKERAAAAELASREKDDFLAVVSHELRTPLTAILGWTQLLQSELMPPARRKHGLLTIERNARAQAKLIDDILDVSRIITGKLQLAPDRVDPRLIVERALEATRLSAEARGVQLVADIELDPPSVYADADRLVQVCSNLLVNAIKFTPRGGTVGVMLRTKGHDVELEIADTGIGIAPEFLPRLFERFRQFDSTSSRLHGGLGLGLSIARHVVELHGGTIEAFSPGLAKGSTFVVRIPAMERGVQPISNTDIASAIGPAARTLAGKCILIVEDDLDSREMLMVALEECRIRVLTAGTAAEALRILDHEKPDVLLLDIGLPGRDGVALMGEIRERPVEQGGRIPAIALTAFGGIEIRKRALAAGFNVFCNKPIETGNLLSTITALTVH